MHIHLYIACSLIDFGATDRSSDANCETRARGVSYLWDLWVPRQLLTDRTLWHSSSNMESAVTSYWRTA